MANIFFWQISRHIEHVRCVTHGTALAAVRAAEHPCDFADSFLG